jgi:hypothetical protein
LTIQEFCFFFTISFGVFFFGGEEIKRRKEKGGKDIQEFD